MSTYTDIEGLRARVHASIDAVFNAAIAETLTPSTSAEVIYKMPTLADGHDPRNKNRLTLTPRGVEILYRVFDDNGGYNRAAKMVNIAQTAAKHRKAAWLHVGGKDRAKLILDIDETDREDPASEERDDNAN